jgi:hypothetical protein
VQGEIEPTQLVVTTSASPEKRKPWVCKPGHPPGFLRDLNVFGWSKREDTSTEVLEVASSLMESSSVLLSDEASSGSLPCTPSPERQLRQTTPAPIKPNHPEVLSMPCGLGYSAPSGEREKDGGMMASASTADVFEARGLEAATEVIVDLGIAGNWCEFESFDCAASGGNLSLWAQFRAKCSTLFAKVSCIRPPDGSY